MRKQMLVDIERLKIVTGNLGITAKQVNAIFDAVGFRQSVTEGFESDPSHAESHSIDSSDHCSDSKQAYFPDHSRVDEPS